MANKPIATPEMLNAVRESAGAAYQASVPVATIANLQDVGNPIITYSANANAFLNTLMNKIVATIVRRAIWENPLQILRKEAMPLGMDVEEVHTNPAKEQDYDGTETGMADLLKMHKPDSVAAWYRMNRQSKYSVTINNDQLSQAFVSWANLEAFIGQIVDSLYNANTIDEFKYTKQLVSDAITDDKLVTIEAAAPVDATTGRAFQVALRNLSMQFTFPSIKYNPYKKMGGTTDRTTWTKMEDQIILIRADVAANVGVEVLSAAFNISYADYLARQIIVDDFASENTLAVLADKKAFYISEKLRKFAEFYNPSALNWQYYYHAWDTFSLAPFYNCVAIKSPA